MEIALVIAVIVFSVTCFFLIRTLIAVQRSVLSVQNKFEKLSDESMIAMHAIEARVASFDSSLRSVSNIGDICEVKTRAFKETILSPECLIKQENINLSEEIIHWAVISAHLYQQIFKRRN